MGRLIRSEEDSGSIILLDNRLVSEPYGKTFLRIWNNEHKILHNPEEFKNAL
ncbi:MAG TPA: helicase C-terminal domain-containing protein [Fibrobacteraceae bacterium]|nr:helicase C-terminal domain-containing protein [Fibrobacteraceae bacterium]